MPSTFFPARPEVRPSIYAYRDKNPDHAHFLKVGYTEIDVEKRVAQQFPVILPGEGKPYEIVFAESAMRTDGSSFMDHAVHKRLAANGFENVGGEWFRCAPADVRNAWKFATAPAMNASAPKTSPCAPNSLRPSTKRKRTSVLASNPATATRPSSFGTPKCALARPSPPTNSPAA